MLPEETRISEIMTSPVVVVHEDETVQRAAAAMRKNNIRGLVVVRGREVQGIITDRDIVAKVVAENLEPQKTKVKEIMVPKIIIASPGETISDVAKRMYANEVGRIPIIDESGSLIGIVTETDITKVCPSLVELMSEKATITEQGPKRERMLMEGRCEECGNHYDDLVEVEGLWLCRSCSEKYTVVGSKKREF